MMNKNFYIATIKLFSILLFAAIAIQAAPGSLDTTFGTGGKVITPVGSFTNYAQAVAIQPDGKIIAVGESNSGMSVARFNVNGTLDPTFNGTGMAAFLPGSAYAVTLLPNGKILVAGNNGNVTNIDFQLRRYNSNGTLDSTFDGDGIVDTPVGPATDVAYAIAVQDGKLSFRGERRSGGNHSRASFEHETLTRLYVEEGRTIKGIAEHFHCSVGFVTKRMKEFGIKPRSKSYYQRQLWAKRNIRDSR